MVLDQKILIMYLRQRFMKVCNLVVRSFVTFQVPHPYSNIRPNFHNSYCPIVTEGMQNKCVNLCNSEFRGAVIQSWYGESVLLRPCSDTNLTVQWTDGLCRSVVPVSYTHLSNCVCGSVCWIVYVIYNVLVHLICCLVVVCDICIFQIVQLCLVFYF